jgi:hypothetical protein
LFTRRAKFLKAKKSPTAWIGCDALSCADRRTDTRFQTCTMSIRQEHGDKLVEQASAMRTPSGSFGFEVASFVGP